MVGETAFLKELDLRFSQRYLWTVLPPRIKRRVVRWKSTDVSEEHIASIFRVEETANQETNMEQTASRAQIVRNNGLLSLVPASFYGLLFDPEDESNMFVRNVSWLSPDYMALYPRT
jgi:hypothetical protein